MPDGSLVAVGSMRASKWNSYVTRFSREGEELWMREFGSPGSDAYGQDVAYDHQGGMYVVGAMNSVAVDSPLYFAADWYLARYSADGDLSTLISDRSGDNDIATGVVADSQGDAYLVGYSEVVDDQGSWPQVSTAGFLKKVSSAGDVLWTQAINYANDVVPVDVEIAPGGGVLMAGYSAGDFDGSIGGFLDGFLAKYNADGEEVWSHVLGTERRDRVRSIAIDDGGSVYVAGIRSDSGESENEPSEAFLTKFNAQGAQQWDRQLEVAAGEANFGNAVAVDAEGNVLLAGTTSISVGFQNGFLAKYSPSGDLLGLNFADTLFSTTDDYQDVAIDPYGSVFAAGASNSFYAVQTPEAHLTKFTPLSDSESQPGDYNGDGRVDAADYTVWRDNRYTSGRLSDGDGDGDGYVHTQDYNIWKYGYGSGVPGLATIPEPNAMWLIAVGAACASLCRRVTTR